MKKVKTVAEMKEELRTEIAGMYILLSGQERRQVAVSIRQSEDTVYRYATLENGVKKLSTAMMMRDEMKRVLGERGAMQAA